MSSFTRRSRRLAAVGALGGLLAAPLVAMSAAAAPADTTTATINLLNINDFHGRIDANTVKFAGTVEQLRAEHPDSTLFLSAGDNIGASLFASSMADDTPTLEVLNALQLQASTVGNHEFDKGLSDLTGRVADTANFPYLGANVYAKGTTDPLLDEYAMFDVQGISVGVIGAVTQETPSLVSPGGIQDVDFGDPVEAVNRVAGQLSDGNPDNGEADVIVAEYHEGAGFGQPEGATLENEVADGGAFADIVTKTDPAVDAIFTGHTHKQYAWQDGNGRPIVQTGSYGENIGQIVLNVTKTGDDVSVMIDDPENDVRNVARLAAEKGATDEETAKNSAALDADLISDYPRVDLVNEIVQKALADAAVVGNQVIGSATADITTAFTYPEGKDPARDDRGSESTLGNFVADALLATLKEDRLGGAEIGVVNPGGLRAELYKGDITYAEANAVLPFVNNLWTTTLTGAQVKTMLEQQWQRDAEGNTPSRAYLQLGLSDNVTYTYDPGAERDNHITSVTVNGEPLDLKRNYRIGTFSFLAQGGDNFHVFTSGENTKDSGLIDRDAWIDYITKQSPISPSYDRRAVAVTGIPTGAVDAGSSFELQLSKLNLTSLGVPTETELTAAIDGTSIGTAPVTDGSSTVTIEVPAEAEDGAHTLTLTGTKSGTVVTIPLTVTAKAAEPGPGEPGSSEPPAGKPSPATDDNLTGGTEGGISTVTEAKPGQTITINVGTEHAGEWVSVWLHSTPIMLSDGFVQVSAEGTVQVTIPADAPAGNHRIVVLAADGSVIGWQDITIAAAPAAADPGNTSSALPRTGGDVQELLPFGFLALGLLVAGGVAFGISRRRAHRETVSKS
ncbi:2',3'-cyclic-nucleotide 2'-phosphodiesterase/5'-or 3'-nucleotidase, 5'-nucleotidase family [Paramicrobacterium humi]|uniref:2',3'-cyclic-nucleotide 2'-phosphodiesterase/5'-or 3'-nucleotidase, 5'-nucleotidase family n=1 Tax=Paramicrobacterium humi TaxID=640635 RepID=A0A1H4MTB1_9MICO|nr:2',3'-cyclic-nucleotide 2'-phosphodiesterase/5'-or 3'-nucleotidase, 5'-nucleotidase family [Microbacterium humi]